MKPYIQVAYGSTGYRIEKWIWNFDADEYVLDKTYPERFAHYYQARMVAASWATSQKIEVRR